MKFTANVPDSVSWVRQDLDTNSYSSPRDRRYSRTAFLNKSGVAQRLKRGLT
jgi:hypothetical protein